MCFKTYISLIAIYTYEKQQFIIPSSHLPQNPRGRQALDNLNIRHADPTLNVGIETHFIPRGNPLHISLLGYDIKPRALTEEVAGRFGIR